VKIQKSKSKKLLGWSGRQNDGKGETSIHCLLFPDLGIGAEWFRGFRLLLKIRELFER